eukprot:scaffold2485_cov143-Skeletonema_menzelii.AAC.10
MEDLQRRTDVATTGVPHGDAKTSFLHAAVRFYQRTLLAVCHRSGDIIDRFLNISHSLLLFALPLMANCCYGLSRLCGIV